jgi:ankyrin repeat protein
MDGKKLFRNIVVGGYLLGYFLSAKASLEEIVLDGTKKESYIYKEECQRLINRFDMEYLESHVHSGEDSNQVVLGNTLLCHVARLGRLSEVKFLLEKGADPDVTGFDLLDQDTAGHVLSDYRCILSVYAIYSHMPLHEAIRKGHCEIAELLLQHGANPDKENNYSTPLEQAALFHCKKNNKIGLKLMQLLLENGANPNLGAHHHHPSVITSPLHIISAYGDDPEAMHVLVNAGGDIKKKRANGNTPLHDAAEHGNYKQMEVLIEQNVDINALNDSHQTPLDLLIVRRNQLKRSANKRSYNRNSSVESYIKSKYEKSLELLRKQGATTGSAIETEKN